MAQRHIIDVDISDRADGLAPVWDAGSATHVYASASGLPAPKNWLTDSDSGLDYPGSPNALDDEFEGGGSLDVKWTAVNNPASGDAFNQTDFDGYLHVGLLELGTDNFANLVYLYQTAPTGTSTMTFTARVALVNSSGTSGLTDAAEFAHVGIGLINSTNSESIEACIAFNDASSADTDKMPQVATAQSDGVNGFTTTVEHTGLTPGEFVFIRLRKTTASAYTSANTYEMDFSMNGMIWQNYASGSKTFTTACDRVGLIFRRPKSATGTPKCEALVDFFRRTA